jgi:hypothetical protein
MAFIEPDFSEEAVPLPSGIYQAKLLSCQQKLSQMGNPYLNWKLEIQSPNPKFRGHLVYYATPLAGRGVGYLKRLIQAAYQPAYESGPFNTEDLIGRLITVTLEKNLDQSGKDTGYLRVTEIAPANEDSFDSFGT